MQRVLRKLAQLATVSAVALYGCRASDTVSSSGTIIAVQFYAGRFLVGADSRGSGEGVDPKDIDKECKITPLGEKMFFAMTGKTKVWDKSDRKTLLVDAHSAAKQAFRRFRSEPNTRGHIKNIADRWAAIVKSEFAEWSQLDPSEFVKETSEDYLASAVFGGTMSDGTLTAYIVYVQPYDEPMLNTARKPHVKTHVIPWNYNPSSTGQVWGAQDKDGVTEFYGGTSERADAARARLRRAIASTPNADAEALTMQFAIKAALDWAIHKDEVGGKIDILELTRGGSVRWIAVKPACQD